MKAPGSVEDLRETLQDRETCQRMATFFCDKLEAALKDEGWPDGATSRAMTASRTISERNINLVFDVCESPIEVVMFNSLVMTDLRNGPVSLAFMAKFSDFLNDIANYADWFKHVEASVKKWAALRRKKRPELVEWMRTEVSRYKGGYDDEAHYWAVTTATDVLCNVGGMTQLVLQPGFPKLLDGKKGIRADAAAWSMKNAEQRLVIECDGFDYHSDRQKFTADRQRDRALALQGFRVVRYSGSEIMANPFIASTSLYEQLQMDGAA